MAEPADGPREPSLQSDSDSNDGRIGPGMHPLGPAFLLYGAAQPFGEIGGHRVEPVAPRARSITVDQPRIKAERITPIVVAQVPQFVPALPAPHVPVPDLPMVDAPPAQEQAADNQDAAPESDHSVIEIKADDSDDDIGSSLEVLDPHGELILVLRNWQFKVCKPTITRQSRAIDLLCREREDADAPGNPKEVAKIILNDDVVPKGLLVALHILHNNHQRVREVMDLAVKKGECRKLVSDILSAAHNYDMIESVAPALLRWMSNVFPSDKDAPPVKRYDELIYQLWIAWITGHLRRAKQTIRQIIATSRLNKKGQMYGFGARKNQPYAENEIMKAIGMTGKQSRYLPNK